MIACGETRPAAEQSRGGSPAGGETSSAEWAIPVDSSPHSSTFFEFDGTKLHYLAWGEPGETIVLLPGLGATAHSFDDFAAALADSFHVVALDPPAHGASSVDTVPLSVDRVAASVVALLDDLKVRHAHLIGHSISGAAITRVAARHPDRVARLVYLDAAFDYGAPGEATMQRLEIPRPQPVGGFSSPAEGEAWARKYFYGTWTPALTANAVAQSSIPTVERPARAAQIAGLLSDASSYPKEYSLVKAPALAIWAQKTRSSFFFWLDTTDTAMMKRADAYLEATRAWEQAGIDRFRRNLRGAEVVAFPAHHAMYITAPDTTLAVLRRFLRKKTR